MRPMHACFRSNNLRRPKQPGTTRLEDKDGARQDRPGRPFEAGRVGRQ